jgi:uncharacterized protein YcbK (DUF882 family)
MQIFRGHNVVAGGMIAATVLFGFSGFSWAKTVRTRVHAGLHSSVKMKLHPVAMTGESVVPGVMPDEIVPSEALYSTGILDDAMVMTAPASNVTDEATAPASAPMAEGKPYQLRMLNLHTGESLDIVYRIGNVYIPEALDKLNYFLRDHYTQDVSQYDPKEFDVLHAMMSRLGRLNNGVIDIVCGYRTPETNAALRRNAPWTGVAEHSQHMEGHAIDIRVPGVSTSELRNAALSLHAGGVGYYPVSQFVHVDVGPVREWVFARSPSRRRSRRTRVSAGM